LSGFVQPFVEFFVGKFELPDVNLALRVNRLGSICRVCRAL
jgi:hypothetical protein